MDHHRFGSGKCLLHPHPVTHTPPNLWEPGDNQGTAILRVAWGNGRSSTIHSPYYCL